MNALLRTVVKWQNATDEEAMGRCVRLGNAAHNSVVF